MSPNRPTPEVIPVSLELSIVSERGTPVLDIHKKPTGWVQLSDWSSGVVILVNAAAARAVRFRSLNLRSGTDWLLTQMVAGHYANDHRVAA